MPYYSYQSGSSYSDYLLSKNFVDEQDTDNPRIIFDIPTQIREQLAGSEILTLNDVELHSSSASQAGFDRLSYAVKEMFTIKGEFTSKFHCAFYHRSILKEKSAGDTDYIHPLAQDKSKPIIKHVFHYENAVHAFHEQEYKQAMEEACKALVEHKMLPRVKMNWHIHQLIGAMQLGFAGCDLSLIDLDKAEKTFEELGTLIHAEFPQESSKAFVVAGWAAYCRGDINAAKENLIKSISLSRGLEEAHFIMAKIMLAQKNTEQALMHLGKSIESEPFYLLKAACEPDLLNLGDVFVRYLSSLKDKYYQHLSYMHKDFDTKFRDAFLKKELHRRVDNAMTDKTVLNLIYRYKELNSANWISSKGSTLITDYEEIVIKEGGLFRKAEVKQVKNEIRVKTLSYNLIGSNQRIEFCFSFNAIVSDTMAYFICTTHVSQALWNYIMNDKKYTLNEISFPAVEITWYDSIKFCNRLSVLMELEPYYHINNNYFPHDWKKGEIECNFSSEGFRLPTDLEWDFAAKGGIRSKDFIFSGSDDPDEVAWYDKNSKRKLQKIAQKKSNESGLYDMSGNVWEWCWNIWKETDRRVLRGGAFFYTSDFSKIASRGHAKPDNTGVANGLRLVKSINDPLNI